MINEPRSIVLQQPVITDYRMGLFLSLKTRWGNKFTILAGESEYNKTTRTTPEAWDFFTRVNNHFLFHGKFLWQSGVVRPMLGADVVIVNANMRMLSNWILLILRKVMGRKTLLWGHASGKNPMATHFRGLFLHLGSGFIAYTDTQKELMLKSYPWLPVWTAPNSCVFIKDCLPAENPEQQYNDIIYVGRLVKEKKVHLLIEGFIESVRRGLIPPEAHLVYVGEGPEQDRLIATAREYSVQERVTFNGHVSDVSKLRALYSHALVSASPGYVGLSATQSFSFGIPMLVARNESHSPEIEACKEGMNASFFNSDDPTDLAEKLSLFYKEQDHWVAHRTAISEWTKSHYSFEVMCDAFVKAVDTVYQNRPRDQP